MSCSWLGKNIEGVGQVRVLFEVLRVLPVVAATKVGNVTVEDGVELVPTTGEVPFAPRVDEAAAVLLPLHTTTHAPLAFSELSLPQ